MNIYISKLKRCILISTLLVLFSAPLTAQDPESLDWTTKKDKWGQLILCQRIYKMPEVKPRLYSFDIEQCDKAGQLVLDVISKYSKQEQAQLKNEAERHAFMLSRNTSEPYHSVPACREYCGKLAEIQDKRSD
jgi:hypothetical protein